MNKGITLINKLEQEKKLTGEEYLALLHVRDSETTQYLFARATEVRQIYYGKDVYVRGLIEFTNYCRRNCYYCGIRAGNKNVERYHLTQEEILSCCHVGYDLGFRTFVLQGGEDMSYTDDTMVEIITSIKDQHPDCAVTLSFGERSYESYKRYKEAGADRFLLRHETANTVHYGQLHPKEMSSEERKNCLMYLKELGFQFGTGFMVGSPFQTPELLVEDLLFIQDIHPQMVGIGPFIPHHETPFASEKAGSVELTLYLLAILRLMLPQSLLPATTALGTLDADGRERGILAGANVLMPNLSPLNVRKKYMIYDNKIATGLEASESLKNLKESVAKIGYQIVEARGDYKKSVN
jgi:biotin synthase